VLKARIEKLLKDYFGEQRIALPAILLASALTVVNVLLWRLGLQPTIYKPYFYLGATLSALVGYYLPRKSESKLLLVFSASTSIILLLTYVYCLDTFVEVTLPKLLLIGLLHSVGFGAIFAVVRILINLGLR
jgi:hypothetical protein